jgi:hypothetical protein
MAEVVRVCGQDQDGEYGGSQMPILWQVRALEGIGTRSALEKAVAIMGKLCATLEMAEENEQHVYIYMAANERVTLAQIHEKLVELTRTSEDAHAHDDGVTCAYCCSAGATKKCTRCLKAKYCSKICQRQHWFDGHKHDCKK